MAQAARMKTTFEPAKVIQPIYTRGNVALSRDGRVLASCLDEDVVLTDLHTGEELARIEGDGEIVTTLAITPLASHLVLCSRSLSMRIYALNPSESLDESIECVLLRTLRPHSSPVVASAVDRTGTLLATGGADGVVKVWDIRGGYTTHTFHGHSGLISALHFFEVDSSQAQEEASKKRKRKSKGTGVQEEEPANETTMGYRLASGGEDGKIRIWNLHKRSSAAVLESHVSVVRSLDFSPEENALLSVSRDKTAIIWDARTWKVRSTVPVLEEIESAAFVKEGRFFYTGGETARLRIWSTEASSEITDEQTAGTEAEAIQQAIHFSNLPYVLTAHADQTLVLHSLEPLGRASADQRIPALPVIRRIVGTHGQIVDVAYVGRERSLLALATNLEDVRIVTLASSTRSTNDDSSDSKYFGADIALMKGHEDIIICMDVDWSGHWLATGAKDNNARLWRLDPLSENFTCYATFTGHAESLGAIALPKTTPQPDSAAFSDPLSHPPAFLVTGSQDQTIKKWNIPKSTGPFSTTEPPKLPKAAYTRKAHDKDINAVSINYNANLFASASQDRTVKIWSTEHGETVGVLRGHRRGVWSVAFSPPGTSLQVAGAGSGSAGRGYVLTGSGDKTVRIWSLNDYSCLVTMEGHTNSVLKVLWMPPAAIPATSAPQPDEDNEDADQDTEMTNGVTASSHHDKRGPLLASAGGDGLVKIWEANSGECAATLDNHTDRVWALAARPASAQAPYESLISGAGDGVLTFWRDTSRATALAARDEQIQKVELDQRLQNLIHGGDYREAIALALQLDLPQRLLSLFKSVAEGEEFETGSWTGSREVDAVVAGLSDEQIYRLLRRVRDWNTNARNSLVAQRVLRAIVAAHDMQRLAGLNVKSGRLGKGNSLKEILEGLRVYSERHFQRMTDLWDESFMVEFTLREMDQVVGGDLAFGAEVNGLEEVRGVIGGDGEIMMVDH